MNRKLSISFNHASRVVSDLKASVEFFENYLFMTVSHELEFEGWSSIFLNGKDKNISIQIMKNRSEKLNKICPGYFTHFGLVCKNLNEMYGLHKKAMIIVDDRFEEEGYYAIKDLDGYWYVLLSEPE